MALSTARPLAKTDSRYEWLLVQALLLVLAVTGTWLFARHGDLVAAWSGFSPELFVFKTNHPEAMTGDFPSGVELYGSSSFMWLYVLAERWFSLAPMQVRWAVLAIEIGCGLLIGYLLVRHLLSEGRTPVVVLAVILVVAMSYAREPDLGRWGAPLYYGLYYTVADVLRVAGIVLVLVGRLPWAALCLGLAFTVHPTMGLMGAAFAGAAALPRWRGYSFKQAGFALILFLAIAGTWAFAVVGIGGDPDATVSADRWVAFTRMMNFHFYPVELDLFTERHWERLFPLLGCVGLAASYLAVPPQGMRFRYVRPLLFGGGACAALVVLGVAISVLWPEPFLVKLALQRASDLILIFASAVAAAGLAADLRSGGFVRSGFAALLIAMPFLVGYGFPAGLAAVSMGGALVVSCRERVHDRTALWIVGSVLICLLLLSAIYGATGMLADVNTSTYFGLAALRSLSALEVCGLALLFGALGTHRLWPKRAMASSSASIIGLGALALSWQVENQPLRSSDAVQEARYYMDVQRWAEANTPEDALFMPDPSHYYGWRAYSHRPSFGNLREWLMTGWFYKSDAGILQSGLKRTREFNVDIDRALAAGLDGYSMLHTDVGSEFYSQDASFFRHLKRIYGVDYVVFDRQKIEVANFDPVYANPSFLVMEISE